jgi:hypothetical protein
VLKDALILLLVIADLVVILWVMSLGGRRR